MRRSYTVLCAGLLLLARIEKPLGIAERLANFIEDTRAPTSSNPSAMSPPRWMAAR